MSIPPREAFAAAAREAIEAHQEWDRPHYFTTLHWTGEKLVPRTVVCIMTDVHPDQYRDAMLRAAREERAADPAEPAYAYLLQIEAFGAAEPGPGASEAERLQYQADAVGRTFHQRADAVESAVAWLADIHGRLWTAAKRRDEPGAIAERFYPPGRALHGHLIGALLEVACETGVMAYGLPSRN